MYNINNNKSKVNDMTWFGDCVSVSVCVCGGGGAGRQADGQTDRDGHAEKGKGNTWCGPLWGRSGGGGGGGNRKLQFYLI